jgi:hypothetical protein
MRKLTGTNTARAVARNLTRKCHVRLARAEGARAFFAVGCDRGHEHTVEIERRGDGLYGQCFFEGTGEACPSELRGRVCYHTTAALSLYLARERQAGASGSVRQRCRYRSEFRLVAGKLAEYVGPFRI